MKLSGTPGGLGWINMQKQYMLISQTANLFSRVRIWMLLKEMCVIAYEYIKKKKKSYIRKVSDSYKSKQDALFENRKRFSW